VPPAARGLAWKPVYCAPAVSVVGVIGYALMPIHTGPADSWQPLHPLVTPAWICAVVGAGVANAVPGAVLVALAAISPTGAVLRWQLSQVVDDGMCELGPSGEVGGITTMLVMPANELPLIDGPWQATQLLVMPVWLIWPLANVAPAAPVTGMGVDGIALLWQASQAAVVGMCGGVRPALPFGVTPKKAAPP
jgi:hypothetical protein